MKVQKLEVINLNLLNLNLLSVRILKLILSQELKMYLRKSSDDIYLLHFVDYEYIKYIKMFKLEILLIHLILIF